MSCSNRRSVPALFLLGLLITAVCSAAPSPRRLPPPARTSATAPIVADALWSWLTHLWEKANTFLPGTSCNSKVPSADEGPFIDPNGVH